MKLIGMLDSPYVRRVAIGLQLLGLPFEHEVLSVFSTFARFQTINPVVKAPTLVCDDGEVLMDSTLILQYAEALARPRSLLPAAVPALQHELRLNALALAAMEKSVQLVYERMLRPAEKMHGPWVERVSSQLHAALTALEFALAGVPEPAVSADLRLSGVSLAVAWTFCQQMVPEVVAPAQYPRVALFTAAAEALPEFKAAPYGDGAVQRG